MKNSGGLRAVSSYIKPQARDSPRSSPYVLFPQPFGPPFPPVGPGLPGCRLRRTGQPAPVTGDPAKDKSAKLFKSAQYGYRFVIPKGWREAGERTKYKSEMLYARSSCDFETYFEKPSKYGTLNIIAFVKTDLAVTPQQMEKLYGQHGINTVYAILKAFYSNILPQNIVDYKYDQERSILRVHFLRDDFDANAMIMPVDGGLLYLVMTTPRELTRSHKRDLDVLFYSLKPLAGR